MLEFKRDELVAQALEERAIRANISKYKASFYREAPETYFLLAVLKMVSQQYGVNNQEYISKVCGLKYLDSKKGKGTAMNAHGAAFNIKSAYKDVRNSCAFHSNKPWMGLDSLFVLVDPDDDYSVEYFYLNPSELEEELEVIGNNSSSLRFRKPSLHYSRWVDKYKVESLEAVIEIVQNKNINENFLTN